MYQLEFRMHLFSYALNSAVLKQKSISRKKEAWTISIMFNLIFKVQFSCQEIYLPSRRARSLGKFNYNWIVCVLVFMPVFHTQWKQKGIWPLTIEQFFTKSCCRHCRGCWASTRWLLRFIAIVNVESLGWGWKRIVYV